MDKNQIREFIAKRAALEIKDGDVVNLGIGLPTLIPNYLPAGVSVTLQSENGMLGMGPAPAQGEEDPHFVNAGGGFITYKYETGADTVNDLIDVALQFDFIKRVNNVTYELVNLGTGEVITDSTTGELMRGKKAFIIDYLKEHTEFRDKYLAMIKEYISASNDKSVLDKESLRAIEAEEDSVENKEPRQETRQILVEEA